MFNVNEKLSVCFSFKLSLVFLFFHLQALFLFLFEFVYSARLDTCCPSKLKPACCCLLTPASSHWRDRWTSLKNTLRGHILQSQRQVKKPINHWRKFNRRINRTMHLSIFLRYFTYYRRIAEDEPNSCK